MASAPSTATGARIAAYPEAITSIIGANRTRSFDALGFAFEVEVEQARLRVYVEHLFRPLAAASHAAHRFTLRTMLEADGLSSELLFDGQRDGVAHVGEGLVMTLVTGVNRRAIAGCDTLLLVHAGGVEHDGVGLVFPGEQQAGKTTLVAGLVRAGFGYLSDEAVAFEPQTRLIRPYPKPLSLDPGAWPLFPELEPHADLPSPEYKAEQWQVPPDAIRPDALGAACPVGVLVFPRFEAGAEPRLERLRRAEALVELAKNTFGFDKRGPAALDLLAEVVRSSACYRLTTGELDRAVELVSSLVGVPAGAARRL